MLNFNQPAALEYFPRYSVSILDSDTYKSSLIELKLYMMFYKYAVLEWVIPESWGDCTFNVYKAESKDTSFYKVNPVVLSSSTNSFKDIENSDVSKFRSTNYILEVILPSGDKVRSESVLAENVRKDWVQIRAREISRRESILLTKFTGVPSLIYRKKTFGKRCPNCWNWEVEKVTKDNCTVCLGTGFEGGYFSGLETLFQYEPTANPSILGDQGVLEPNTITAWTINTPEIENFDLVVRLPDFKIYRVENIQCTELQTVKVRQIVTLTELSKSCVEYDLLKKSIPINLQ